jgi:predicted membrane-bound spermidine synthase
MFTKHTWLFFFFFISGFSSIIYQIAWQKLLFQNLGSDIESSTIIVSTFMAGLGTGALLGGYISSKFKNVIFYFCIFELIIGLYGLISYELFLITSNYFIKSSFVILILTNFFIFLVPTVLMGATLPLLIIFILKKYKNIGNATGKLYKINTFGAAFGSIVTGFIIFIYLDLKQSIFLAALLNIFLSYFIYKKFKKDF